MYEFLCDFVDWTLLLALDDEILSILGWTNTSWCQILCAWYTLEWFFGIKQTCAKCDIK